MNLNSDFRSYTQAYFARLLTGVTRCLDHTYVRAWSEGHLTPNDAGGNWDMVTRTFPALAAYLAGDNPRLLTPDGTRRLLLHRLFQTMFLNAFDPTKPGYWGARTLNPSLPHTYAHQHTVEAASLAYGAWLLRDRLADVPTEHFRAWLRYFGQSAYDSNWQLFLIVNHSARKALGWDYDQPIIDRAWEIINGFERAGGYMTDGSEGYFDDYNWWVFGTHELMWLQMDGGSNPALAERVKSRIRKRLEDFPYYFGAGARYTEYGRSLAYKFARLGLPLLAYKMGLWPHSVGMLQTLVRQHLAHYDNLGAITRDTHVVRQELAAHGHPDVVEPYINTGHPYWCMLAFAGLWQIASDDPIWTCAPEPLPVERASFARAVPAAGWILDGDVSSGCTTRYALGSRHGDAGYGSFEAKYAKFEYRSHFPINIGAVEGHFGPDASLCLADTYDGRGEVWVHPRTYEAFAVGAGERPTLRARHVYAVRGQEVRCETVLIPLGQQCLRVHRLVVPEGLAGLVAIAGGAPLGFAPGTVPALVSDAGTRTSSASVRGQVALIADVTGFGRALRPMAFRGNEHVNLVWDRALVPAIGAQLVAGPNVIACLSYAGPAEFERAAAEVTWEADGSVRWTARVGGKEVAGVVANLP